jgi:pimeloyl-ACP methyl ester carboxylesterase
MGGFISMELAACFPDKVSALVLVGSAATITNRNNFLFKDWAKNLETGMDLDRWFRGLFYWIFSEKFFENEVEVNKAVRLAVSYPYLQTGMAFRNQVEALTSYEAKDVLSNIRSRTLVINGKEDLLFTENNGIDLANDIPGAFFKAIDNVAHAVHVEQPKKFTDTILEFLSDSS